MNLTATKAHGECLRPGRLHNVKDRAVASVPVRFTRIIPAMDHRSMSHDMGCVWRHAIGSWGIFANRQEIARLGRKARGRVVGAVGRVNG